MSDFNEFEEYDALIRALREPGTPDELADEAEYAAMFRRERGGLPGDRHRGARCRRPRGAGPHGPA